LQRFIHFQRSAGSLGSSAILVFTRLALKSLPSVDLRFLLLVRVLEEEFVERTLSGWVDGALDL
jgi:hypothetical protein